MESSEINQLGKKLDLFANIDYIGKGFPIVLPNGARIIKLLRNFVESTEEKYGFKVIRTPSMSRAEIYKIADTYEEDDDFFFSIKSRNENERDENILTLKPYAHPFHCATYNLSQHTYKELPIKYCETSTIFRNEKDVSRYHPCQAIY